MPLQLGLVGLPNVGKSTLFNALTQAGATVASYPFTTIKPNVGVVPVPDERLQRIADLIQPERVVSTTLRVVDIAGLVRGASRGEGLGNQFLSHIRDVDAIAMVVRCFDDETVPHVTTYLDPVDDMETIELELILADLEVLERHLEGVKRRRRSHPDLAERVDTLEMVAEALRSGQTVRQLPLNDVQREVLRDVALLTIKPALYVANVSEECLPDGGELAQRVRARAESEGAETVCLCAPLEAELIAWDPGDASAYLAEVGLKGQSLERFVWAGYRLLDYITFFTTTGGHEVRAWTLRRGQTMLEAAGKIHTDMARGFIRAEVIHCEDMIGAGSATGVREAGQLRLEGRDYIVQDGDVIHVRFAV